MLLFFLLLFYFDVYVYRNAISWGHGYQKLYEEYDFILQVPDTVTSQYTATFLVYQYFPILVYLHDVELASFILKFTILEQEYDPVSSNSFQYMGPISIPFPRFCFCFVFPSSFKLSEISESAICSTCSRAHFITCHRYRSEIPEPAPSLFRCKEIESPG